LVRLDLDSGKFGDILYQDPQYDVGTPLIDEWTGRNVGVVVAHERYEYHYFEPAMQALQRGVEAQFPGLDARVESLSRNRDKAIVIVQSPTLPPTLYFLDRTSHRATKIASTYPALSQSDLGEMKAYPYKARDGMNIEAFLTLPPGRKPEGLPVVVLVHGGPDDRDVVGFDWWAQFLANRGYAIFQTNYRGSSGYGAAYTAAGLQQWGLKMQDDISDGVKKLVADGVADPKRICIVGANYGGYAALAGATFTPDLYACAASFAGISDLTLDMRRIQETTNANSSFYKFVTSRIGDPVHDEIRLAATSPALHADQVKIPILLMHGSADSTVRIEQSEAERDALQRAGKNVQYERIEGDDHYFTLADTRIEMLRKLEAFLAANIGR
jgi:dipeptidyl aminopeptidase/acylaminoacyl peptidase